jgi:hypothetical protein
VGDLIEHNLRPDHRQVVVDSFTFAPVPFENTHQGTSAAQVRSEFGPGGSNGVLRDGVRIVGDHDLSCLPYDPVQVRDNALHVDTTAVRSDGLADRSTPVKHAGKTERDEPRAPR